MSDRAFRSATKNRREHRERSQPSHRSKKLGPLEKKKDYKIRARKTHLRDDTIRLLKEKAALKNPDEFYYAMTSGKRLPDGTHVRLDKTAALGNKELVEMKKQDISYLEMKREKETAIRQKLENNLHFIGAASGKHTIFVDDEEEAQNFSAADYFNTEERFLTRRWNRPTPESLESSSAIQHLTTREIAQMEKKRAKAYGQLSKRLMREKELSRATKSMTLKKNLMSKEGVRKKEKSTGEVSYVWKKVRKA